MNNYKTYIGRIITAISQLCNAFSGGNPDISISAKIGFNSPHSFWFRVLEYIVDFTFYPIDGPKHCYHAYRADADEDYSNRYWLANFITSVFVVLGCIILIVIFWGWFLLKKLYFYVRP